MLRVDFTLFALFLKVSLFLTFQRIQAVHHIELKFLVMPKLYLVYLRQYSSPKRSIKGLFLQDAFKSSIACDERLSNKLVVR